jgi:PAS domain S-box-containing protein
MEAEYFRVALRDSAVAIYTQDCDLRYTWAYNSAHIQPEQIIGKTDEQLMQPEPAAELIRVKRQVLQSGVAYDGEFHYDIGGEVRYFDYHLEPLRNQTGAITGLTIAALDVTDLKRAKETLSLYELLAGHSRDIILFMRRDDGHLLEVNAAACTAYGYSHEELLALTVHDLRAPGTRSLTADQMAEAHTKGILFETYHQRKDGSVFPVEVSSRGADIGGTRTLISVVRDITERRRAEELLERQANLLEQTHDAIVVWRLHCGITYWNHACEELYGWTRAEALGRVTHDLLQTEHPVDDAEIEAALERAGRWNGEVVQTTRDGRRIVVESRRVLVHGDHGESLVMETNRDITERKQAEQALEGALALTHELYVASREIGLASSPVDVLRVLVTTSYLRDTCQAYIVTYDHLWTEESGVPEGAALLASYTRADLGSGAMPATVGQHFPMPRILLHELQLRTRPWLVCDVTQEPRISAEYQSAYQASLAAIGVQAFAVFPLVANGENFGAVVFYFDSIKSLSAEDVRHVQGLVSQAAVGIFNQLVLEMEKRARQEAERANEMRLRFLGMISHELRTPLTSIKGFATTLLAEDVTWAPPQQRDFLQTIDREADKLTDMIDQLLDLSRIESGSLRIEPQPQPLGAIFAKVRPLLDTLAQKHRLEINLPDDLPPVLADAQRVGQVLANLVGNAAKYTPPGTRIKLSAECECDSVGGDSVSGDPGDGNSSGGAVVGYVRVDVADEGPGIPVEERAYMFEAFRRGNDGLVRQTKGAGLGLAICKGLVEAHGGHIWLRESDQPGTTISFTLPVAGTPLGAGTLPGARKR